MFLLGKNLSQLRRISHLLVGEQSYVVEFLVLDLEELLFLPAVLGYNVGVVVHLQLLDQVCGGLLVATELPDAEVVVFAGHAEMAVASWGLPI